LPDKLKIAQRQALYSVALMRALTATRSSEAAATLLRFAYRHRGAFRDECGRLLRQLADDALPALIRASGEQMRLRHPSLTRYAVYQLDQLDRRRPDRALIQRDDRLLADILRAYGETRTPDSAQAVVGLTDHRSRVVQRAARWATLRFLTGRRPKQVKRQLLLAGGRRTDREQALFLTYRQLAKHAVAKSLLQQRGIKLNETTERQLKQLKLEKSARELALLLFQLQDARIEAEKVERVTQMQRLIKEDKAEEALALADEALDDVPVTEGDSIVASVFLAAARAASSEPTSVSKRQLYLLTRAALALPPGGQRQELQLRISRAQPVRAMEQNPPLYAVLAALAGITLLTFALLSYPWWQSGRRHPRSGSRATQP
jgi:hypothetical protein